MQTAVPTPYAKTLKGDMVGGVLSAIIALPISILSGLLAFSPLGPDYVAVGVLAGLTGAFLISLTTTVFGGSPLQISGPRSSLAMIMAAVLIGLNDNLVLPAAVENRELIMLALMYLCLVLAGAFQVLFGFLKLGSVIKFAPRAVIAGLINGFAVLIIYKQLPVAFGLDTFQETANLLLGQGDLQGLPILVASVSIVSSLMASRYFTALPGSLVGLLSGMIAYHLFAPTGVGGTDLIGAIPRLSLELPPHLSVWHSGLSTDINLLPLVFSLVSAALALAFLSSAISLLSMSAIESLSHNRYNGNKELLGQGLANMVSGLFGGLAGGGSTIRSVMNYKSGGRTRWAGAFHATFIIFILLGFSSVIELIPLAAIAGILIVIAIQMFDKETLRQAVSLTHEHASNTHDYIIPNITVTFLVMVLTLSVNFVVAVGVGMVVSSLLFSVRMGKIVVRSRYQGDSLRSKTSRPREALQILENSDNTIMLFEAQGPIFFGTADQLAQHIEDSLQGTDIVILDLRRVTAIDDTGFKILQRLEQTLSEQGKLFFLSHLHAESPLWAAVRSHAGNRQDIGMQTFIDSDSALSKAEDILLAKHREEGRWNLEVPLTKIDILHGLTDEQVAYLDDILDARHYRSGEQIIGQGEDTTEMYLLSKGAVSVVMNVAGSQRTVRLSGLRPGVTFGEMGMINETSRSTSVIADQDVSCFILSRDAFQKLVDERSDIVTIVLINMMREMSNRLRVTSTQVSELEQ